MLNPKETKMEEMEMLISLLREAQRKERIILRVM